MIPKGQSYGNRDGVSVVKKLVVKGKVPVNYVVPKTIVQATGAIIAGWNVNAHGSAVARVATAFSEYPPYAVKLSVVANAVGTAGGATGNDIIRFKGYTAQGKYVQEDVYIAATAAGKHYTNYAYAKLTSVQPNAGKALVSKSTSVAIGYNPITIGLPYYIATVGDILTLSFYGTYATTAATVSKAYQTLTLSTTANGQTLHVLYLSKVQD